MTFGARRNLRTVAVLASLVLPPLAACSESSPSILTPSGPSAQRTEALWWFMFAVSAVVVVFVTALLLVGALGRRRRADEREEPRWARGLLIGGGIVFPVAVLAVLWALTLRDVAETSSPPGEPTVRIEVDGKRWWWDVRYPELGVVTANEIHVPVGETVQLLLTSDDIIHSFWVPQLAGKLDLLPNDENTLRLQADEPATYRSQCAEFCGLQHANMRFIVVAEAQEQFDEWLAAHGAAAADPATAEAREGRDVFLQASCVQCHVIGGVNPQAEEPGPDLTHFARRSAVSAALLPDTRTQLRDWVADPHHYKEGTSMPPADLPDDELDALVTYLESLQ